MSAITPPPHPTPNRHTFDSGLAKPQLNSRHGYVNPIVLSGHNYLSMPGTQFLSMESLISMRCPQSPPFVVIIFGDGGVACSRRYAENLTQKDRLGEAYMSVIAVSS